MPLLLYEIENGLLSRAARLAARLLYFTVQCALNERYIQEEQKYKTIIRNCLAVCCYIVLLSNLAIGIISGKLGWEYEFQNKTLWLTVSAVLLLMAVIIGRSVSDGSRRFILIHVMTYPAVFLVFIDSAPEWSQKAIVFGDAVTNTRILRAGTPAECKKLGRQAGPYNKKAWEDNRVRIVYEACKAKFQQNPDLKERLLATGDSIMAEASPYDTIWGIGLDADAAANVSPEDWPGQNLLGRILMELRDEFQKDDTAVYFQGVKNH